MSVYIYIQCTKMYAESIRILKEDQIRNRPVTNVTIQPSWRRKVDTSQAGREGDERVALFLYLLDNFGYVRNADQVEFHRHLFLATIDKFYGAAWSTEMHRVMKIYGITEIQRHVIMLARRRLGKTVAVCQFQAAKMICIPGETDIVLSTNQRISLMIMQEVMKMLGKHEESRGQFKKSGEKLTYYHTKMLEDLFTVKYLVDDAIDTCSNGQDLTTSKLLCYPGSQSKSKSTTFYIQCMF